MLLTCEPSEGCLSQTAVSPFAHEKFGRLVLDVGGIAFGLNSRDVPLAIEDTLAPFAGSRSLCDVEIETCWTDEISEPSASPLFSSGGLWSCYPEGGGAAFYFRSPYFGEAPYKKACFDPAFRRGRVLLLRRYFDPQLPLYPLEYPLDELMTIHRLAASGAGAEVHACGVSGTHGGTLFVGHSGAGKSTTSRLWSSRPDTLVLSDDRIILRERSGEIQMHGTPWHGDAGIAAQACCKLNRIFILEHGPQNEILALPHAAATAELFTRTFVPHYDPAGIDRTLRFLEKVVARIPISRFRFVPDATAVEAILRAA